MHKNLALVNNLWYTYNIFVKEKKHMSSQKKKTKKKSISNMEISYGIQN